MLGWSFSKRFCPRLGGRGACFATLVSLAVFTGCVSDYTPAPPRMPTVGVAPPPPVPVVSAEEALARAALAADQEAWSDVRQIFAAQPPTARPALARALTARLVPGDFAKAERLAIALPAGPTQSAATEELARAHVQHDPAAALTWALGRTDPALRSGALQATAERLVEHDAAATIRQLLSPPETSARDEMLGYAAAAWVRREPRPALGWLQDLAPGDLKDRTATSMGFALAQFDPPVALELLQTVPAGRNRQVLIGAIGQTWVARHTDDAWRWARQLPEAADREAAFAGIETGLGGAGSRASRDGRIVAARIRGGGGGAPAPDGTALLSATQRDDALRREFTTALQESPARAADWLTRLPPSDRRDDMVDDLLRRWLPDNPAAAKTWIDQNISSPTRREFLLREAEARGY